MFDGTRREAIRRDEAAIIYSLLEMASTGPRPIDRPLFPLLGAACLAILLEIDQKEQFTYRA